jgi:stearoyl-CoA desaturase (delta-9 desaturase)
VNYQKYLNNALTNLVHTFDADYFPEGAAAVMAKTPAMRPIGFASFIVVHVLCLGVFFVGWSPFVVTMALLFYMIRMFAVTAFYHRYFSHRTFQTSRPAQFVFAVLALTAAQRGPLWWAAHHRNHHRNSDKPGDSHSPVQRGFWWAHMGWISSENNLPTDYSKVPDLAKYPELVWLNRFDLIVPMSALVILYFMGEVLHYTVPSLHTSGAQVLIWTLISQVFLYHGTFAINSLAHVFGNRRFETEDDSRNNFWLALITFGEGWHNNHHKFPGLAHQGIMWWEVDFTYYILKVLEFFGIIWDVHRMPADKVFSETTPREFVELPKSVGA